jgi:hypothetical protein
MEDGRETNPTTVRQVLYTLPPTKPPNKHNDNNSSNNATVKQIKITINFN